MGPQQDVDFCGKIYHADKLIVDGINIAQKIAEIESKRNKTETERRYCGLNMASNYIGVSVMPRREGLEYFPIVLYDQLEENQRKDPFDQAVNHYRIDFDYVYKQNAYSGSFHEVGKLEHKFQ